MSPRIISPMLAALGVLAAWHSIARADDAPARYYVGVGFCVECHEQGRRQRGGPPLICTCLEADKWLCRDKHQDAFNVLDPGTNPRAKRMAELLGYDPRRKPECLSCHSTPGVNEDKKPDPPYGLAFRMEDGVSCVACHGAYDKWLDPHGGAFREKWRQNSREDKESKYGMTDLWNPARRSEVCGSCHIGDRAANKVVTHEMYAAGHPPLSGFELASFCDMTPRHWQLLTEKSDEARKLLHARDGELEQTRLMVVGTAASLRQAMRLLADEARQVEKQGGAIDFARMDCAACHHDLRQPSWRQARGYDGRPPGRPGPPDWPTALLPAACALAGAEDDKGLEEKLDALDRAFGARPFGDAKQVADAAEALADWATKLTAKLNDGATRYDRRAGLELLRRLARLPAGRAPDFDSARQIAWAFRIVYAEVYRECQKATDDHGVQTFKALKKTEEQVKTALGALALSLDLNLPPADASTADAALPPADDKGREAKLAELTQARQALYDQFVPAVLKKAGDYDPAEFQKSFAALARLLP